MASGKHFKDKDVWEFDNDSDTDYSDPEVKFQSASEDLSGDDSEETPASSLNKTRNLILEDTDDELEKLYFSKDESIVWSSNFPSHGRRLVANISTEKPGVKGLQRKLRR